MILPTEATTTTKIEGLFFKTLRKALHTFYTTLKLRPGSAPYLTGDSFRALANHIHDETGATFNPSDVKTGDIVFVGNTKMTEFFTTLHPKIANRYILIQHNGDFMVDEKIAAFIDDKIIHFYAQVTLVHHTKITPIPVGIANRHHGIEIVPTFGASNFKSASRKRARIFFHFSIQTNPPERGPALEYFNQHPAMDTIHTFVPYLSYKKILASYCFTASPAGNTLGSHRTWEALYLQTIPIVKRTVDAESCVALGLPLWIVDDWHELSTYTETDLRAKYESIMATANYEALYMDYWTTRIKTDQLTARSS